MDYAPAGLMVHQSVLAVLALLFAVGLLQVVSSRLRMSLPIVLVLGGIAISYVPNVPRVRLDPDVVFLVFLPPLLYEAAWFTSLRDFWRLRNAVLLQALGLVLVTSVAVAFALPWLVPGAPLALGFLLGGIVSPPDAVAATSVLRGLPVPKTAVAILEGESLVNDASSLIVFRFALATLATGQFSLTTAASSFFAVSIGGVLIGLVVGHVAYLVHKRVISSSATDTLRTLITPYLMYLAAESVHCSGVLAVVTGGLYLSSRAHEFLGARSRVQATGVWSTVVHLLNSVVFIFIGLQLPLVVAGLEKSGGPSLREAIGISAALSVLVIAVRLGWVFFVAYTPRLFPSRRHLPRSPDQWKIVFLVGWAGMRGVVSLASALAVPLVVAEGVPFPHRDLIVFTTFGVIFATLVIQGITMPVVVRWLKFPSTHHERAAQARALDARIASACLEYLRSSCADDLLHDGPFARLAAHYEAVVAEGEIGDVKPAERPLARYQLALHEIAEVQRVEIVRARRAGTFDFELIRERQEAIDLEAARHEPTGDE